MSQEVELAAVPRNAQELLLAQLIQQNAEIVGLLGDVVDRLPEQPKQNPALVKEPKPAGSKRTRVRAPKNG